MNYASCDMPRRSAPIVLGIVLALTGVSAAEPAIPVSKGGNGLGSETKSQENGEKLPKLNLRECIAIAFEKQPKLKALRASLGSAGAAQRGLDDVRLLGQLNASYKYRKSQAANGVCAAAAELEQAQHEVTQAVIWTYYTSIYASEQMKVAKEAVLFIANYKDQVEKIVTDKKGTKEINQITLNELVIRLSEGKRLLIKAQTGQAKAQAALREAMGVNWDYRFEVADSKLPEIDKIDLKKETVIAHAQTRRGEVIMAGLASDVTQLEAYVQWSQRFRFRVETFATGADIHSRTIPVGVQNGEYRPGAIGPEMPSELFGSRSTRYQRAWELTLRSQAVLEKTRNLVALEAENSFIDYEAAIQEMAEAKIEAEKADANLTFLLGVHGDKIETAATLQKMLEYKAILARAQAAMNEANYHQITALAALERITAGGIKVNYPDR